VRTGASALPPGTTDGALILTLDIGTSSMRALLWNTRARAVPGLQACAETPVTTLPGGGREIAPEPLLERVTPCIDALPACTGGHGRGNPSPMCMTCIMRAIAFVWQKTGICAVL